ncbi:MAG: FMN-binding protein [Clostridia bacterium]|nr:FMN-binding protein [Clostridia bacterium]
MVNKKTVWSVANIGLRLLIICLVVAALTALVYAVTKDPIAEGELARKEEAIRLIFVDAADFAEDPAIVGTGVNTAFSVTDAAGNALGWCVDYTGTSDYGGDVNMMIGVGNDRKVIGVQIISHSETFIDRYLDDENRYTGIDQAYGTDLSAGATMSYNAIRNAIASVEKIFAVGETAEASDTAPLLLMGGNVKLLFADAASISEEETVEAVGVNEVRIVKNEADDVLGRCVYYTATGGYNGNISLLVAVDTAGKVIGMHALSYYDSLLYLYLDENDCYVGVDQPRDADVQAGATRSYTALRNAIEAVEALQLGGA